MGENRRSTAHFLQAAVLRQASRVAWCIFCGASAEATQRDHVPARALFWKRQWPQGYEFPACAACNHASRSDEQILALLVRVRSSDTEIDKAEVRRALAGVKNNHPGLAESLRLSLGEKRRALRTLGMPRQSGTPLSDVPLLSLRDARWHAAVSRYSGKLTRALFFHHANRIAPLDSEITSRWLTSLMPDAADLVDRFAKLTDSLAVPVRQGRSLDEQFVYRFAVGDELDIAAFLILFGPSLCILSLLDGREESARRGDDLTLDI